MTTTRLEVVIITPQYDPGKEPVFYRWVVNPGQTGLAELLVAGGERSTTQADLGALLDPAIRAALDTAGLTDVYWGDTELAADLEAHLATMGLTATVVTPE